MKGAEMKVVEMKDAETIGMTTDATPEAEIAADFDAK